MEHVAVCTWHPNRTFAFVPILLHEFFSTWRHTSSISCTGRIFAPHDQDQHHLDHCCFNCHFVLRVLFSNSTAALLVQRGRSHKCPVVFCSSWKFVAEFAFLHIQVLTQKMDGHLCPLLFDSYCGICFLQWSDLILRRHDVFVRGALGQCVSWSWIR